MRYCTRCRKLFEGPECPDCQNLGRTPQAEDWCLLDEQPKVFSDMLRDVLEQNGIPSTAASTQGGLGLFANVNMERYKLYVPYPCLEQAALLKQELFSADGAEGEEGFPPEESGTETEDGEEA